MSPKDIKVLLPGTSECYFTWQIQKDKRQGNRFSCNPPEGTSPPILCF